MENVSSMDSLKRCNSIGREDKGVTASPSKSTNLEKKQSFRQNRTSNLETMTKIKSSTSELSYKCVKKTPPLKAKKCVFGGSHSAGLHSNVSKLKENIVLHQGDSKNLIGKKSSASKTGCSIKKNIYRSVYEVKDSIIAETATSNNLFLYIDTNEVAKTQKENQNKRFFFFFFGF